MPKFNNNSPIRQYQFAKGCHIEASSHHTFVKIITIFIIFIVSALSTSILSTLSSSSSSLMSSQPLALLSPGC